MSDHIPNIAYIQTWEEHVPGVGYSNDGFSVHLTLEDAQAFIDHFWGIAEKMKIKVRSVPIGSPYEAQVEDWMIVSAINSRWGVRIKDYKLSTQNPAT